MASIKYTAFVNEVKGKISGTVMQGGYGGSVIKGKDKKGGKGGGKLTHADAGRLVSPRLNLTQLSTAWQALTDAQRLSWASLASGAPVKNRFSENYIASGFQMYMQLNGNLLAVGHDVLVSAPILQPIYPQPSQMGGQIIWSGGHPIWFTNWQDSRDDCCRVLISNPVRPSTKPNNLSFATSVIINTTVDVDTELIDGILAVRGTPPSGSRIWLKGALINLETGQFGEEVLCFIDVP